MKWRGDVANRTVALKRREHESAVIPPALYHLVHSKDPLTAHIDIPVNIHAEDYIAICTKSANQVTATCI